MLDFIYDESGKPFALKYTNGTADPVIYYYVLNLQGDVVKLITESGTAAASYTYTAWGEILTSSGTMASINPLRYRGYYYDTETGFYYLQSRYYDPITHRFINADSLASTGQGVLGYNMFAYCLNSPVNRYDMLGRVSGEWFKTPEDAAADFGNCYNGQSIASNEEYATFIYEIDVTVTYSIQLLNYKYIYLVKNEKRYAYTTPAHGEKDTIEFPFKDYVNGYRVVAVAHTHAAYDSKYDNEIFSVRDCEYAINNNTVSFLITPGGFLKKYNPQVSFHGTTICSNIVHDPNSPDIKKKRFLFWEIDHTRCSNCAY